MSYEITRLGHLGDGVAEGPGFAARTLPGEVVDGDLDGQRLNNVRILEPSDLRVRPPCPSYKSCGGCALQHVSDPFVSDWKADLVRQAIAARGIEAQIRQVHTSPPQSRRRAKLTARRTKSGAMMGYMGRASHALVDVQECLLLPPGLSAIRPVLLQMVQILATRKSVLEIHLTDARPGPDVAIDGCDVPGPQVLQKLAGIVSNAGISRLTIGDEVVAQQSQPLVSMGLAEVPLPPRAFLQATEEGQTALIQGVVEALDGCRNVADLFSGAGTFTFPLAEFAAVQAEESESDLTITLEQGRNHAQGLKPITVLRQDLFRNPLLAEDMAKFDGLCLDPPRAGAEAQARHLADAGPAKLAFVSCDPGNFARDAAILSAAYDLTWIDIVDQFRWSPHVELVAQFVRKKPG